MAQFDLNITLEYSLIGSDDKETFVDIVNEWTGNGWQPLGGPFVYEGDLCQAVVREKPQEPIDHTIVRRSGFTFKDVGGLYVKIGEDKPKGIE